MMHFSIRWERVPSEHSRRRPNVISIKTTLIDEEGRVSDRVCLYEEWIGVCTSDIARVVRQLQVHFPKCPVRYSLIGPTRKILPYFEERVRRRRLDSSTKPFYKVYVAAPASAVGQFFHKHKISYYDKEDWSVRLYIDLCTRNDSQGFYYKWYTVTPSDWLLDSFRMHPERTQPPDWTIGAFDLETVPMDGAHRVPTGLEESDEIVMISLYTWNRRDGQQKWLLYRLPCAMEPIDMERAYAYASEEAMLNDFHALIGPCQVLTGYNIVGYDLPCVFARLVWLQMGRVLRDYSSVSVGQVLVPTYQKKSVLDLYHYFRTFSSYDLPGFKLDDVAKKKLNETKVPVDSTGLWVWYTSRLVCPALVREESTDVCHRSLRPERVQPARFGTFPQYMAYCLQDSHLVVRLFREQMVLSFLVERANFADWNVDQALYMGNSSYLMALFKTYGTRLGFFVNTKCMKNPDAMRKLSPLYNTKRDTYQGALNYCVPEKAYSDVSVMDFASMYPSTLYSSNLCYGTCTIMTREEWQGCSVADDLTCIPFRTHDVRDFEGTRDHDTPHFRYPAYDSEKDEFAIVINTRQEGFLPRIVKHFIELRKRHQGQYKTSGDIYHYNVQLCTKLLINSLYGCMANELSCLAYTPIAMTITTLSRYQLLGSYHFLKRLGFHVCYADTDSLMVEKWPTDECGVVNEYLDLPAVELKYEQRMTRLLVLCRKRYIYETERGAIVTKGFQKRINELVECLSNLVLDNVWSFIYSTPCRPATAAETWWQDDLSMESRGWLLWVELVQKARYECRDSEKYSICRKTKHLSEYKSKNCAVVRMLEKCPEKANDYIYFTYAMADVAQTEASRWVMSTDECKRVDYKQMFLSQKKIFCTLLNMACWKRPEVPIKECDMVMNALRWKQFVQAELLFWHETKRRVVLMVLKGLAYTFSVNEHLKKSTSIIKKRRRGESGK